MDIKSILLKKFGFEQFRAGQEEVIRDVISGRDTIAILPTGSGKSLCYQLPAYTKNGAVLIVSPLGRFNGRSSGNYEKKWRKTSSCSKFFSCL